MLEASLPGLWSLSMTDAHNFAEGAAGLCMPQLAVAIYPVASATRVRI